MNCNLHVRLRTAILASAALHLAVAGIVVVVSIQGNRAATTQPALDTRICNVHANFEVEAPVEVAPAMNEPPRITARPPTVTSIPETLTPDMREAIERSQRATELQPAASGSQPARDPHVKPAGAATSTASGLPLHGGMKPGQSVVYLLDCSGSMGEFGKLDRARSALIATLRQQPAGVRWQVVSYNSTARPLLAGSPHASATAIGTVENALSQLEAAGRGNPTEALRLAVNMRPDFVVWLTDAEDLVEAKLKPILTGSDKVIPVFVATVTATGVGVPRQLR